MSRQLVAAETRNCRKTEDFLRTRVCYVCVCAWVTACTHIMQHPLTPDVKPLQIGVLGHMHTVISLVRMKKKTLLPTFSVLLVTYFHFCFSHVFLGCE